MKFGTPISAQSSNFLVFRLHPANFLAHLSRRFRMNYCDHLPSIICLSTLLNDFSSETSEPVLFKLHVEPSVKGGLKSCTNGHGPLIKVATMPIYGVNT